MVFAETAASAHGSCLDGEELVVIIIAMLPDNLIDHMELGPAPSKTISVDVFIDILGKSGCTYRQEDKVRVSCIGDSLWGSRRYYDHIS